jgi:hypothetical protein
MMDAKLRILPEIGPEHEAWAALLTVACCATVPELVEDRNRPGSRVFKTRKPQGKKAFSEKPPFGQGSRISSIRVVQESASTVDLPSVAAAEVWSGIFGSFLESG